MLISFNSADAIDADVQITESKHRISLYPNVKHVIVFYDATVNQLKVTLNIIKVTADANSISHMLVYLK